MSNDQFDLTYETPEREYLLLRFDYDYPERESLVDDLKSVLGGYRTNRGQWSAGGLKWDKGRKAWRIKAVYLIGLADILRSYFGVDITPDRTPEFFRANPAVVLLGNIEDDS